MDLHGCINAPERCLLVCIWLKPSNGAVEAMRTQMSTQKATEDGPEVHAAFLDSCARA
jgi:hypothetical protein